MTDIDVDMVKRQAEVDALIVRMKDPNDSYDGTHNDEDDE